MMLKYNAGKRSWQEKLERAAIKDAGREEERVFQSWKKEGDENSARMQRRKEVGPFLASRGISAGRVGEGLAVSLRGATEESAAQLGMQCGCYLTRHRES